MHFDLSILDSNQVYLADSLSIKSGISGEVLMENAGKAVADFIIKKTSPSMVYVFCGSGNNGGDGYVTARLLKEQGYQVKLFEVLEGVVKGDALLAKYKWKEAGGIIDIFSGKIEEGCKIIVDAICGIGLSGELSDNIKKIIKLINQHRAKKISIDIPTGVNASTGEVLDVAVLANYTISFFKPKIGQVLLPGKKYVGELVIAQIGIVEDVLRQLKPSVFLNDPKVWQKMFVNFDIDVHKYQKGVCMVVAGEQDYIGASKLASLAAARSGCGMVKLLVNRDDFFLFSTIDPSLIIKSYDNFWGMVSIMGDDKISSFVVGPGLGVSDDARKKVIEVLKTKKPVVIDADAISTFANNPKDLFKHLHQNCVLTPHMGEFQKLFKLEGNKIEQAINAAKQTGAVIVYKGNDTVITDSNKVIINANSSNNLATAGSGDVLSGIIAGLLAEGMTPFYAAAAGVWLHAETARPLKIGMIASDIISHLPKTLNSLVG